MQLHTIKRNHPNKKSRQVGRGTTRGKTAGRGTKGQKARAGHKIRPEIRDIIKKLPKRRGYGKNRARGTFSTRPRPVAINLSVIDRNFEAGTHITPTVLTGKKLIRQQSGKLPMVKILGQGDISQKFTFTGFTFSAGAKEKIEKAGGVVI